MTLAGITCELLQIEDSLTALHAVLLELDNGLAKEVIIAGADAAIGIREHVKKCIEELDKISGG